MPGYGTLTALAPRRLDPRRLLLLLLGLCLAPISHGAAAWHLLVPDNSGIYGELYLELRSRLPRELSLELVTHGKRNAPLPRAPLWIAAGPQSLRRVWQEQPEALVIAVFTTRDAVASLRQSLKASGPYSAIYHDPAPWRQLRLAKAVVPRLDTVGVLVHPGAAGGLRQLENLAAPLGIRLVAAEVAGPEELVPKLVDVLKRSDALLALPEPSIINRQTLKTVLLTAYRRERVLIGSSDAMVSAGSLATTYSNTAHTAEQLADWLANFTPAHPQSLPAPEYTRGFTISYNKQVARSLSFTTPDLLNLETQLLAAERASSPGARTP